MEMGRGVYQVSGEDEAIIEVFPRLINQMIVEVMKPDAAKSAAIATFEAMCNFWRTLRWLVDTRPTLLTRIGTILSKFVSDETHRHKDNTPDLGAVLVLFTALQGHAGCPTRSNFIEAYADENSIRWVMWWHRSNTKPEPIPVFQATQVSREICMFQMMVVDLIIADVSSTLKEIEETNCKLPQRLEKLQGQWRQQIRGSLIMGASVFLCQPSHLRLLGSPIARSGLPAKGPNTVAPKATARVTKARAMARVRVREEAIVGESMSCPIPQLQHKQLDLGSGISLANLRSCCALNSSF